MPSSSLLDWLVEQEPSFRPTRLPSLYSDLTVQRTTNPEGYAANVSAWTSALTRLTLAAQLPPEQHHLILQTSTDLLSSLASHKFGQPSGLGCVIDDCVRHGKMIDIKDFVSSERSIYSKSWIPSPWAVLRWGLRQVGVPVGNATYETSGGGLRGGRLVVVAALEDLWKRLQAVREKSPPTSLTDRVLSREAFVEQVNACLSTDDSAVLLSEQDLSVFLRYLARDKQVLTYDNNTVKYKAPAAQQAEPLTPEDGHIASLKLLISKLTSQVTALEGRIASLQVTAQQAVKQHSKASALSALRSKKLAERTLESRTATLHQLEEVYTKIEAAVDQVQIVRAIEASAGVLKSLNEQVGGVERVEDVLDRLREEMGKVDEVSGVIAEPLDAKAALDEGEIDDELEELEKEEIDRTQATQAEDTRKRLAELEALEQQQQRERDVQKEKQQQELEKQLSSSTEKLRTLDLHARAQALSNERDSTSQGAESTAEQNQRIPEQA